jgi:hypothetical protein
MVLLKLVEFQDFTVVTMNNASSWMWLRLGLVRTDVLEKRLASVFKVEKSASEEKS